MDFAQRAQQVIALPAGVPTMLPDTRDTVTTAYDTVGDVTELEDWLGDLARVTVAEPRYGRQRFWSDLTEAPQLRLLRSQLHLPRDRVRLRGVFEPRASRGSQPCRQRTMAWR